LSSRDPFHHQHGAGAGGATQQVGCFGAIWARIHSARVLAFADLGMEAIYEFDVVDMPVTVAVDSLGSSVHQTGPAEWQAT